MAEVEAKSTPWQDEETLRRLYWDEEMPMPAMADKLGCSDGTILRWMKRHDIDRRRGVDETGTDDAMDPDENTVIGIHVGTRDEARTIKQDLGLTWDEFVQKAAEELDPDNDDDH